MSIYAIGDLHLPGHDEKPMNVFGGQWDRHFEIIQHNWRERVRDDDIVLIPGDVSWALQLRDALDDLYAIAELPGKKIMLRGNHDYWWGSISKVRAALRPGMYALQNDALALDGHVFCGARGWTAPTAAQPLDEQDERIYKRELLRLRMSLQCGEQLSGGAPLTVMTHFPPLYADGADTAFTDILEQFPVRLVVYGHLHGSGGRVAFHGERNGIRYYLTSCDLIDFTPICVDEGES